MRNHLICRMDFPQIAALKGKIGTTGVLISNTAWLVVNSINRSGEISLRQASGHNLKTAPPWRLKETHLPWSDLENLGGIGVTQHGVKGPRVHLLMLDV